MSDFINLCLHVGEKTSLSFCGVTHGGEYPHGCVKRKILVSKKYLDARSTEVHRELKRKTIQGKKIHMQFCKQKTGTRANGKMA